ncbi:hypothetical protein I9B66_06185 [Campylobacter jejuni]|nr:hypothetical protein [Campylobacter jejuni]MBX2168929.1 hypothetical protein [Campylobacter jejuni]
MNLKNINFRNYNQYNRNFFLKNGKHYPRLTTKIENVYIGINPQKIELFLDDLIKTFDERILKYCQD